MADSQDLGKEIRRIRRGLRITQKELALASGTGLRFIIDLEKGKPTCQLEKCLQVINSLGIELRLIAPELP